MVQINLFNLFKASTPHSQGYALHYRYFGFGNGQYSINSSSNSDEAETVAKIQAGLLYHAELPEEQSKSTWNPDWYTLDINANCKRKI
jgi:hypothetical protein